MMDGDQHGQRKGLCYFTSLAYWLACSVLIANCATLFVLPVYATETITYTIEQAGGQVGKELVQVADTSTGMRLSSRVRLSLVQQETRLESDFDAILDLDGLHQPARYSLKGKLHGRAPVNLDLTFSGEGVTFEDGPTIPVNRRDLVILDNMIAAHYLTLLHRYKANGMPEYRFNAFVPQVMLALPATMSDKGGGRVRLSDGTAYLHRYHIVIGSVFVELWVDDEGRLMRVSVPGQKIVFFHQKAATFELTQEPPPASSDPAVVTEEVAFPSGDITLSGAIRRPRMLEHDGMPAVLFLSGSGRQDRDGKSADGPIHLKTSEILNFIAAAGCMVLSYDDRGIGLSAGSVKPISFTDEVQDAGAALAFLTSHARVDRKHVFLIGHSSGAIVASKLAGGRSDLAGVVLMAAPGRPLREILVEQLENTLKLNNANAAQREAALKEQETFFDFLENYRQGQEIPAPFLSRKDALMWLQELIRHDSLDDYARLTCPVLILQGGKDVQIREEDARRIAGTLKERGNDNVQLTVFPGLDHLFMPSSDGNIANYYDRERPISTQVLEELKAWLSGRI